MSGVPLLLWIVLGLLALVVVYAIVTWNRFVRLRTRVDNGWSGIDVQLRRRYDLIPNLVETVKGYASHERATFEEVTKARTRAQDARTVEQQAEAENVLTAAIGRLFAVAEAYPELRASENFRQLQTDLTDTEGRIAVSRQVYNDTVLTYNNAVQTVPANLVAGVFGFDTRTFFEVEEPVREAPAVRF
jgi:LemA protein